MPIAALLHSIWNNARRDTSPFFTRMHLGKASLPSRELIKRTISSLVRRPMTSTSPSLSIKHFATKYVTMHSGENLTLYGIRLPISKTQDVAKFRVITVKVRM